MPGPRRAPRFPFDPIDRLLEHSDTVAQHFTVIERTTGRGNTKYIAQRVGVTRESIYRYRRDGLPEPAADRIAVALGRHPAELWPDYYEVCDA